MPTSASSSSAVLRQLAGRRGDLLRGGGRLLRRGRDLVGRRRRALGHLGDGLDVAGDAVAAVGHLVDGGGDLGHALGHLVDGDVDALEGRARGLDRGDALLADLVAGVDGLDGAARLRLDLVDQRRRRRRWRGWTPRRACAPRRRRRRSRARARRRGPASMAALRARRLVCLAMPAMVSTIVPISSDLAPSSRMVSVARPEVARSPRIACDAAETVAAPSRASVRVSSALRCVAVTWSADAREAPAISSASERVRSTAATCSRAPCDMPSIAVAISSTARPASPEVAAICCEAAPRRVAEPESRPTSERSCGGHRREGGAEDVALGARSRLHGQIAASDAPGGVGGFAQIGHHPLEGLRQRPDLVAAAHVEVVVEVALGDRVGGDEHAAHRARHGAEEGQEEVGGEHDAEADDDEGAPRRRRAGGRRGRRAGGRARGRAASAAAAAPAIASLPKSVAAVAVGAAVHGTRELEA